MPSLNPNLRSRLGKICVAITGNTPSAMIERAGAVLRESSFVEFRLDYLDKSWLDKQAAAALAPLAEFLAANPSLTAIATCRRADNGGNFKGSVAAELEILIAASLQGFHLVDLELQSAEALKPAELDRLRETPAALILSWHDFAHTPDLDELYGRIERLRPDLIKIVPTADKLTDNLTVLRFLERVSDIAPLIGIAMGAAGIPSRVLGLRAGSLFTFASHSTGEETAPGQIDIRTLIDVLRVEEIDAATRIFGVAGSPASASLSPLMMNTAFRRERVNAVYLPLETASVDDLLELITQLPLQGLSVTMPHKQAILPHLAHTDPLSKKIGAVNTVLRAQDGKLYGFNTDVAGILVPLEKRIALKGAKVLVLGAGGSARAAVFALRDKGAEVSILNRTPDAAAKLARQSGAKVLKREALCKQTFDVILNATPVGMAGNTSAQILTAADFEAGLSTRYVFDLVYNPIDTPLLRLARQRNLAVITGVEMFLQQGARQFEIWTGKPAPEEEMQRVVVHALRQRAEAGSTQPPATPNRDSQETAPAAPGPEAESKRKSVAEAETAAKPATRAGGKPAAGPKLPAKAEPAAKVKPVSRPAKPAPGKARA